MLPPDIRMMPLFRDTIHAYFSLTLITISMPPPRGLMIFANMPRRHADCYVTPLPPARAADVDTITRWRLPYAASYALRYERGDADTMLRL